MSSITVREAAPAEFAAIDALLLDVYVGEGYTPAGQANTLAGAAERAAAAQVLVACDASGGVLGSVTLAIGGPIARISRDGEGEMRLLAVSKAARGRGVGEALASACVERAREAGCARVVLYTQPTMTAAHRIYERAGFVREAERDFTNNSGIEMRVYALEL